MGPLNNFTLPSVTRQQSLKLSDWMFAKGKFLSHGYDSMGPNFALSTSVVEIWDIRASWSGHYSIID